MLKKWSETFKESIFSASLMFNNNSLCFKILSFFSVQNKTNKINLFKKSLNNNSDLKK